MAPLHIHLDAVGGAAGDMLVAALLDARPDLEARVRADLAAVLPPEAGRPRLLEGFSGGLRARRFRLDGEPSPPGAHGGPAGSYRDMRARITGAALAPGTAGHALAVLRLIAETEAALHGVAVDAVHFHEIADWDSLADVVAVASLAAGLGDPTWSVSPLPRGGGLVKTQHGLLPVPAPATAALLAGFTWRDDGIPGERVTPTAAAALRHLCGSQPGQVAEGRLMATGTGAGTRDLQGLPNVLRALVFEPAAGTVAGTADTVAVITFDIDDMTGEEIGTACDRLRRAEGVLDVSLGSRLGKKGRPLQEVRLLARPEAVETAIERCFAETATIGLRWHLEARRILPRAAVETEAGVRVKLAERPGGLTTAKAENDQVTGDDLAARRRSGRTAEDEAKRKG
jgi:hypothetical protein